MLEGLRLRHLRHSLRDDGVAVITIDRDESAVNALSSALLDELGQVVERISIERPRGVVFLSGKDGGFSPGADLDEFQGFAARGEVDAAIKRGQDVFTAIANLAVPTVAAIHGHCLGGGTELALACDARVAASGDATRIGLPEVKLGIFPGWGGSVRLPRLIGAPAALDLMLTGRTLSARKAKALGLVDRIVERAELEDSAAKMALGHPKQPAGQRLKAWLSNLWPVRQILAAVISRKLPAKAPRAHYPAPYALLDSWRRGGSTTQARLASERRAVVKLAGTATARNLTRLFFLSERLKNLGGRDHDVKHVHVVGAGVMGGDIAAWCAMKGFDVSLQDRELSYVTPALERAAELFERKINDPALRAAAAARLNADVDAERVGEADLLIEAIFEDADAKRSLYATLQPKLGPQALLTSNTSSLPIEALADGLAAPERFAGLHYFNPVAKMPLVEIVRHDGVADATIARLAAFCRAIDKLPIPVAGSPGFLVNRILMPYLLEAMHAYAEGVPGPAIDRAARRFGMPMGPIELADTIGLDVAQHVGAILAPWLGLPVPDGIDSLLEAGHTGRKSGQGFYQWQDGRAVKPDLPKDYKVPEDLTDRLILPLVNEAVACLADGVVEDEDLLDAGVVFGTGFAPHTGGPLAWLRSEGIDEVRSRLKALEQRYGPRFAPRPGWDSLRPSEGI